MDRLILLLDRALSYIIGGIVGGALFYYLTRSTGRAEEIMEDVVRNDAAAESAIQQAAIYGRGSLEAELATLEAVQRLEGMAVSVLAAIIVWRVIIAARARNADLRSEDEVTECAYCRSPVLRQDLLAHLADMHPAALRN